jgi:transposase-like protein
MNASNRFESAGTTTSPPACPACRSASVTTTAKNPDVDSYWRCERCGEIWNIGRRHDRPRGAVPWR